MKWDVGDNETVYIVNKNDVAIDVPKGCQHAGFYGGSWAHEADTKMVLAFPSS